MPSPCLAAAAARRALKRLARPAGAFDARRYFRGTADLRFYNVGTAAMRKLARSIHAQHASERERHASKLEYRADELCLAWLLEQRLFEEGWDATFEGEITGLIPSGLFARFGDVFEGYIPARRLPGDYFELNELATALVGRRGGRTYRLGDRIEVRVADLRRSEGKVELELAGGRD